MIKLIGGVMIVASSMSTASYIASHEKKKIEEIEAFISLIRHIRNQIDCFSMPMKNIFSSCSDILSKLGVSEKTSSLTELISKREIMCAECEKIINDFSSSIGKGHREREVKICDKAIGELEHIKEQLVSAYPSKRKTTAALCLAIGGAMLIALL